MKLSISQTSQQMGALAARQVQQLICQTVKQQGEARILVSTGQSQFEFFESLVTLDIPWEKVDIYHLDEYVGCPFPIRPAFENISRNGLWIL